MKMNRTLMGIFICSISINAFIIGKLSAQLKKITRPGVHVEGTFYEDNGKIYADAIVVKFKEQVINLPRGERYAAKNDIQAGYSAVTAIIHSFEQKFESVALVKQIPNARWGDTTRKNKVTGQSVQINDLSQLFTIRFSSPVPLDSTIKEFLKLPQVEFAHEPISIVYFGEPNDDHYQDQWNLQAINALAAWNITKGSNTVKIGIVDNGVNKNHEDLQGKIDYHDGEMGSSEFFHGTTVPGVAAAATNNGKGISSLGWEIRLYTYGNGNLKNESFTAQNISDAAENVDVINMSFGTLRQDSLKNVNPDPFCSDWGDKQVNIPHDYPEIAQACSNAVAQGIICVASAGNNSLNEDKIPESCDPMRVPFASYPAKYPWVIAVSGTKLVGEEEQFPDGWNYGDFVDVAAPAVNIWVTTFGGGYHKSIDGGTSYAAPLVSALAALIKSVNPDLAVSITSNEAKDIITSTADKIGQYEYIKGKNDYLGYGRINAHAAVLKTLDESPALESISPQATAFNNSRKLAKNGSILYLVYEKGNQIFFTQSTDNGST